MSKPDNNQDSAMAVTLTVGQWREIMRQLMQETSNGYQPEILTANELADRLKMPVSWVYEQSRLGNIPKHTLGRYIRFDLHEVLASQKKD